MSCSVFAADNTAETDLLKALNIIDNTNEADKPITRIEFLKMALKLADEYDIADKYEAKQIFKDVPANSEYADVVAYAYDAGYIIGWDGQYEPERNILLSEANTVLIRVTDYSFMAEQKGTAFVISSTGMNTGIDAATDAAIKKADAFKMIYNMLEVPYYEQLSAGGKITMSKDEEHNMLEYFHDVYKERGILTAAKTVSLTDAEYNSEYAIVSGEKYLCSVDNAEDFVGQEVVYYYSIAGEHDDEIIAIQSGRNKVLELEATELMIDDSDYGIEQVIYTNENGKRAEAKLDVYADMIYNGEAYPDFNADTLKIREGNIKLIDNNNNGTYDVIVMDEYKSMIVDAMNTGERTLTGKDGTFISLDNSKGQSVVIYGADGSYYEFGDIATGNVATIFQSKSGRKTTAYITVTVLNDQIEKVRNTDPRYVITVGGTDYEVDRNFAASAEYRESPITTGTKTGLCLDMYNRIVGVGEMSGKFKNYGFIFAAAKPQSTIKSDYYVKVFTEEGVFVEYTLKEKLLCDGDEASAETVYNTIISNGTYVIVEYSVNAKNEITAINFPVDNTATGKHLPDTFSKDAVTDGTQNTSQYRSGIFGGRYRIDANTVVFGIPDMTNPANRDEKKIKRMSQGSFTVNKSYVIEVYDLDETYCAGLIVSRPIASSAGLAESWNTAVLVVESVATALDEEGEEYNVLSGWFEGKYVEYPISTDEAHKDAVAVDNCKQGDVFRIQVSDGKIISMIRTAELSGELTFFDRPYNSESVDYNGARDYHILGRVGALENGAIVVSPDGGATWKPNAISSARVYLYDRDKGEITLSNMDNIYPETALHRFDGDIVYMSMRWNSTKDIIIIRD